MGGHVEVTKRDEAGEAEKMNSLEFYPLGLYFIVLEKPKE